MPIMRKTRVVEKFKSFLEYVKANDGRIGTKQRGIDINVNNACNLRCKHCFTNSPLGDHVKDMLPLSKIAEIADQADELGIFEWDMQGGELLLRPNVLFDVIAAIKPERFYLYVTTNGTNLDADMAKRMGEAGVDRVSVSIDSMDAKEHDDFRGRDGSWKAAIEALEHVQAAGMSPFLNITVAHYNAFSKEIERLFEYSKLKGYTTLVNVATPAGMWQKMSEIMCDDEDRAHLIELRKQYKNVLRNLWNPFNRNDYEAVLGCNTVNRLYVTPLGDVLPCPYVHIKLGNVYEQTLKEISDYGFSIKYFREHSPLCLAGEDKNFVKKFLQRPGTSIFKPVPASEAFSADEFVRDDELLDA